MRPSRLLFLLLLFSSPFHSGGAAFSANDSFPQDSELKDLDEKPPLRAIVTATRREMPVEKSTRFATVLTREDIEKSGAVFVVDLLRALPGITVTQSGPLGRTVGLFVRGMNSNQTLVMIDGVQINSLTTGQAELADLTTENIVSVENIERIEILRGPQSTLYGPDAMAGVINIVTKAGKRPFGGEARFEYGTHQSFYEAGVLEGQWKNFSYSGSGSRLDTEGPGENDGFENSRAGGHAKLDVGDQSHLDVAFHFYNALAGIEDGVFQLDPNRWQKAREQILSTVYTISPFESWHQSLKYSFFHDMLFSVDPPNEGTTQASSQFKLDMDRHTFEWQNDFYIGDLDVVTAGYEFEHGRGNNKSFDRIIRNHGWFLQNELTLWEKWTTVTGIRVDENQFFGTEPSPEISTAYEFQKTRTRLKGSFGRGIRAPTLNDLFFPNFGNPDLLVEKSWGWDAGFEQPFLEKKASFGAAYFHNSVENLIQFTGIPLRAQNIDKARTQGVELESKYTPNENFEWRVNYTYLDAVDTGTGKRLIRRPWHSGRLGFSYRFWKCHLNVDWALIGDREDRTAISGRPPREKNPGYTRLDATLTFDLNKWTQFYLRGENLTNDHYDEVLGFDNPSTRLFAGTKARF